MKIEITCIDALCMAQLVECMHLVNEPDFKNLRKRILYSLRKAGFRPCNENDVLLPTIVKDTI